MVWLPNILCDTIIQLKLPLFRLFSRSKKKNLASVGKSFLKLLFMVCSYNTIILWLTGRCLPLLIHLLDLFVLRFTQFSGSNNLPHLRSVHYKLHMYISKREWAIISWYQYVQWTLNLTNLYIAKPSVQRMVFLTPLIVKYHEICGKEPRYNETCYSEHILAIAWLFDTSRFHWILFANEIFIRNWLSLTC